MTTHEVVHRQQVHGFETITEHCHYFFGTAACTKERLAELFPQYQLRFLKQVHGDQLVLSQSETPTADAHWTEEKGIALVVQTADCMPVLFGSESIAIAAHAGWRGIENAILLNCARFLREQKVEIDRIMVGPHIQAPDFEVGREVANQLVTAYRAVLPEGPLPTLPHSEPNKLRVNLAQIAGAQIRQVFGPLAPLEFSRESTFSSPLFHSYRRGKATANRQYSFIARI